MRISSSEVLIYFALYSVIGWLWLVLGGLMFEKKLRNRGFLAGPYAPIYGLGAMLMLAIFSQIKLHLYFIPLVAVVSILVTGVLAFLSAHLFEGVFKLHFWRHFHGRPQMSRALLLLRGGIVACLGVLLVYVIHPWVGEVVRGMSPNLQLLLASGVLAFFIVDFVATLNSMYRLREKIAALDLLEFESIDVEPSMVGRLFKDSDLSEEQYAVKEKLLGLTGKDRGNRRILLAFSELYHTESGQSLDILKEALQQRRWPIWQELKKRIPKAGKRRPEEGTDSFAHGLNFYKLFWVFFIGSIAGFLVETLYCYIVHGRLESRQGLLYGPFSQIYGFGAVIMVLLLNRLVVKGDRWVFLGGALIGGAFEFCSSLFQEYVFHASSWNYSGQNFAFFGGRTSLLYMFFWGILGVVLMKEIYPRLSIFVERIPNKQGPILSWILIVLMSLNIFISTAALWRWSQRSKEIPATNSFSLFLDKTYPNSRMETIYSGMDFIE